MSEKSLLDFEDLIRESGCLWLEACWSDLLDLLSGPEIPDFGIIRPLIESILSRLPSDPDYDENLALFKDCYTFLRQ